MTREQAIKRLRKLYGDKAYWRVGQLASSPEQRAEARAAMLAAKAERDAAEAERRAFLDALPAYQEIVRRREEARERFERARGMAYYKKFEIGERVNALFTATTIGDTWEDCFANLDAKKATE